MGKYTNSKDNLRDKYDKNFVELIQGNEQFIYGTSISYIRNWIKLIILSIVMILFLYISLL